MQSNLSFQNILAALGTSAALVACGGAEKPPAEVPSSTETTAAPKAADVNAAAPAAPSTDTPVAVPAATAAPAPATSAAPAAPASSAKPAPAGSAKPGTPAPAKKSGAAGCGAGTCSAKK